MHPSTRVARAPGRPEPTFNGLVAPIFPSTTYVRDESGAYPGGRSYSRDQNPTGEPAEQLLNELEGGAGALLFSSGMAAATALLDALEPGTHIVAPRNMYWTIRGWLQAEAAKGAWRLTLVDNADLAAWDAALRTGAGGPQLAWLETPSNPLLEVIDVAAVSHIAHEHGAIVAADNTTATPVHMQPLSLGVDVVFHSATKQLNGHGDVLAGALVASPSTADSPLWDRVQHQRAYRGAVLGPFESWLLLRGMRTLWVRVVRSSASAQLLATELAAHPALTTVLYPGLTDHPGHDIAARQMRDGFGMLMAIRVAGGAASARRVLNALELFADATSLGSTESLVEHRARIEGADTPVPDDLLRLSIGLEDPADLLADLRQALDRSDG